MQILTQQGWKQIPALGASSALRKPDPLTEFRLEHTWRVEEATQRFVPVPCRSGCSVCRGK